MRYNKGAILRSIAQPSLRSDVPQFDSGDTVRVDYKVVEGSRSRIQAFEGIVIAKKNGKGARATVTIRKVSFGEGVERVFPLHSPLIDKISIIRRGRTRRSKLYYLRNYGVRRLGFVPMLAVKKRIALPFESHAVEIQLLKNLLRLNQKMLILKLVKR